MLQVQTGLMITGAEKCYFAVYDGMFNIKIVEVLPDPKIWKDMIGRSHDFYRRFIEGDEIPDDKPEILEIDDQFNIRLATRYVELDRQVKEIKAEMDQIKADLLEPLENSEASRAKFGDVMEVSKTPRLPRVDWKKILLEREPGINLDKVEKEWKERLQKESESEKLTYTYRVFIRKKEKKEKKSA